MKKKYEEKQLKMFVNFDAFILVLILLSLLLLKYEIVIKIVGIVATIPVVLSALSSIKNRKVSIDLLASIALIVSLIEREWISVAFINLMITSARMFARYVQIKSHSALQGLIKSKPTKATVEKKGKIFDIPVEEVVVGDRIIVELGEKIPADGLVEKGEAMVDQSSLTGESVPVFKKEGDKVLSFTTVVSGNLTILVEKVGEETSFEKIIKLIEASQGKKAEIETTGDIFSKWYISATIIISLIIYFYSGNINLVLSLLLVSCADDIAVAIPLALSAALTHSAMHGVIVKGGGFIEEMSRIKIIFFDKTGTLTFGKLAVENVFTFNGNSEKDVLAIAGTASLLSHHPVAVAISDYVQKKNKKIDEPEKMEEIMGRGIIAIKKGEEIITGNVLFFKEKGIAINKEQLYIVNEKKDKGFNIALVGKNNKLVGFIVLADKVRPDLKNMITELKRIGIEKTIMLTGDNENIAERVTKEAGIDEFHANLLPEQKTEYLNQYMKKYKVAMVGDGVNDAPCLAIADIGIVMGAIGSDSAIESADIAIMRDDLSQIPELIKISRRTISTINQNLLIWGVINIIGFILVFSGALIPASAAAYNFGTDFIPILNSLRLFR
jgi:Cd2+/Zn2+-exporting ATPase